MAAHPLDDPALHALTGPHRHFATIAGAVSWYDPEVSFFTAVERFDAAAWSTLEARANVAREGGVVVARTEPVELPSGWEVAFTIPGHQFVLDAPLPSRGAPPVRELTAKDVPAMLDLVGATKPGPFFRRTIELGGYLGIEDGGALVAMAGERLHLDGWTEISAVCTDPAVRGRGYAAALTGMVARTILERGQQPFLHVADGNDAAARVYERLGFRRRTTIPFVVLRPSRR
ncbi:MAG: GNAT family N-acetyltransferase [Acidimicrobiia bacterium]|nr:GNAT family N-acetyltransferase [Acidimicrobiia bacterium]